VFCSVGRATSYIWCQNLSNPIRERSCIILILIYYYTSDINIVTILADRYLLIASRANDVGDWA